MKSAPAMLNIGGLGSGGSELGLIGLPMMSWSLILMVNSPKPGARDPEFTVGFPKPLSASQVAAYRVQTTPVRYMFHYWKRHIRQK